ncbi:DUF4251 domain-containing protein [uncultured Bacteroides sp.]|uniref:DUF4251 domain-containing protein n=1 Tax=uncultured Bacteroides sp. TaxID=162156 RepID=UPI002610F78F|nr:DUF4251 domain-containing protein [uncultured Bacteroides sp.]
MRILICMMTLMAFVMAGTATAQETRKLTKKEKKALQARVDSLQYVEAERAINEKAFVLEADRVVFKRGHSEYVNSNTNFVSVKDDRATVQVSFNIPSAGPNGVGGVTVEGSFSKYDLKKDKKGNISLKMNVTGSGISASVDIMLYNGSSKATVDILPNFNSNRISLEGVILPLAKSRVFKGRSF